MFLHTAKIAERCGYGVLHGIVDSIWIKKRKYEDDHNKTVDIQNYLKLKELIEQQTVLEYHLKAYTSGLLLFIPKQMIFYLFPTAILEHLKMVL
jgi:DNA polymerase elongation subunit (family B)